VTMGQHERLERGQSFFANARVWKTIFPKVTLPTRYRCCTGQKLGARSPRRGALGERGASRKQRALEVQREI